MESELRLQGLLLVVLAVCLVLGLSNDAALRRLGARKPTRAISWLVAAMPWGLWQTTVSFGIPYVAPALGGAVLAAVCLFPEALIVLTGGPDPIIGLGRARDRIEQLYKHGADPATIDAELAALERWRTPDTAEYIDLYRKFLHRTIEGAARVEDDEQEQVVRMNQLAAEFQRRLGRNS